MPFDPQRYNEVIILLHKRGRGHRLIATTTLAASCVVFIVGVLLTWYWTNHPFSGLAEAGKLDSLRGNLSPIILAINSLKILSLAAIYYLGYLLASVFRYNIRLSGHYVSRSYALMLVSPDTPVPLEVAVGALDPNVVTLDKLPTWAENHPLAPKGEEESKSTVKAEKAN
jgi:hypothetical protein